MHGARVSGGYQAGFVYTERQAEMVREVLADTTWERTYAYGSDRYGMGRRQATERMGKVRAKVRKGIGFAGVKGFIVVAQTKGEFTAVERAVRKPGYDLFQPGQRVRTVVELRPWARPNSLPMGTMATVIRKGCAGDWYVTFDGDAGEYECPWQWFEAAE